ncbi:hypothetical protein FSB78_08355 [Sphingomonas ginsenosidivorax]|uniref:Inovirus Gp2 family protein n=1 Tax=Sphingomonas ginsenosidivorax TaxID=862135 RepID=A0A5C6UFZ3_9SPHN|nr:hypothetical protein [Sphingomonas ginsenosidivorax]TXC70955.1 hypothetical protein FSB78_08355 [Sphingomonas ginsenosidivorax]
MMDPSSHPPAKRLRQPIVFTDGHPDPFSRQAVRTGILELIKQHGATHSLTLNINREMSIENAKRSFSKFCYNVDQDRFRRKRVDRLISSFRFSAIAFIEHPDTNIHLHAAVNLSPAWLGGLVDERYVRGLEAHWDRITRGSGSMQLDRVFSEAGWGRYITKSMRQDDSFLLSTDFHSDDSVVESSKLRMVLEHIAP